MNRLSQLALLFLALCVCCCNAGADNNWRLTIPLEPGSERSPLITVQFPGQHSYLFLVDTGSPATLMDRKVASDLRLTVRKHSFADGGEPVDYVSSDCSLGKGVLPVDHMPFVLADLQHLDEAIGGVSGIIGTNMLYNFAVRLDFTQRQLVIQPSYSPSKDANSSEICVPMTKLADARQYTVEGSIDGHKSQFIVDTGARETFVTSPGLMRALRPVRVLKGLQNAVATKEGTGMRIEHSRQMRLKLLEVGSLKWTDPIIIERSDPYKTGLGGLGMRFFQQYRVVFDFPQSKLYLSPDPGYVRDETEFVGVGVDLLMDPATHRVIVSRVYDPSPAKSAGLAEGDEIAEIDGQQVTGNPLDKLRSIQKAMRTEGQTISIGIMNGSGPAVRTVKVVSKRLL